MCVCVCVCISVIVERHCLEINQKEKLSRQHRVIFSSYLKAEE
jgi:hypothetical protein